MVSVYCMYATIAKNWHRNIVLQAELYLRTGTYDRPKKTLAIDSARQALAIDAYLRMASYQIMAGSIDLVVHGGKVS